MKILSILLIATVAFPLGFSITTAYIDDTNSATPQHGHAFAELVSTNLTSEPGIMILIGTGMIMLAGFGKKRLVKKDNDSKQHRDFRSTVPPYPDPVPWKKD